MSRRPASNPLAGQRILIVLTTLDLGGAERQALHLASYLQDQRRAQVDIVALFGGLGNQAVRRLCVERRLPCLRVSMPEHIHTSPSFRSLLQFAREIHFLQPDILLPYTSMPNVLCGVTWRQSGAKTCLWNQRDHGLDLPSERWQRAALANTPWFLTNARSGMDCLVNQRGIPAAQVRLVFNGVAPPPAKESSQTLRPRLGISDQSLVGVMLANLHCYKDHETLIRAWKLVDARLGVGGAMPPTLLLAGREDDAKNLKALVSQLELTHRVRFLGPVDDVSSLLNAADLSLLSSDNEGTPNAVIESMAAGLPVVATDIRGCRDALGEDYEYLVPAKSPEIFAQHIINLARDPEKRAAVGQRLQARAHREFTLGKMCGQTCTILEEALVSSQQ